MTRRIEQESWLLDVVREILRLEDMANVELIARKVYPILYRRCVSTCKKLINLQEPQKDASFVDANEFSFACVELRRGFNGVPRLVWSNRKGVPSFGIHDEQELSDIVSDWWTSYLGVKPVAGNTEPPINPCDVPTKNPGRSGCIDNVLLVGQYQTPRPSRPTVDVGIESSDLDPGNTAATFEDSRPDLLFLLVRGVTREHKSVPDGQGPCPCAPSADPTRLGLGESVCHTARTELYQLSKELNRAFESAPTFIRSPVLGIEDKVDAADDWAEVVLKEMEGLRAQLSFAEIVIRRWHFLLMWSRDDASADTSDGWIVDPLYFPNDITFNVCIPDIPRILHLAWQLACSEGSDREHFNRSLSVGQYGNTSEERQQKLLVYCMLHARRYWQPGHQEQAEIRNSYGAGDPKFVRFDEGADRDALFQRVQHLLQLSDGAQQLREVHKSLMEHGNPPEGGWDAWQNRLEDTWSGLPAMHIPRLLPFPFNKRGGKGKERYPGPNRDFDDWRLPESTTIIPFYEFDGQVLGFGLCCLPLHSRFLLSDAVDWRELEKLTVRLKWMPGQEVELTFVHDVLKPELERLSRRVLEATLGLSLATINAVRHIVCVKNRSRLPPSFIKDLKEILVEGFVRPEGTLSSRSTPADAVVRVFTPQVLNVAIQGFEWINWVADELHNAEVLLDFIREFGHVFGKHTVGSLHNHARLLIDAVPTASTREQTRADFKRLRDIASVTARRIAAIEYVGNFYAARIDETRAIPESTRAITMPEVFDFFSTLPGHRMWEATSYDSLNKLEDIYWSRLGLVAHGVPWDMFTPLFTHVYEGLVETVLETLIHNAFKHGPIRSKGKVVPAFETKLRVYVSFHRAPLNGKNAISKTGASVSAVAIWSIGSGFTGGLCQYMIGNAARAHGDKKYAIPFDLFRAKRVDLPGHEERKGIGLRVLLHCLEMQTEALRNVGKEEQALHLFLIHRRAVEDPAYLGDAAAAHPELLAVVNALRDVWELDGISKPGSQNQEAPGVFVLAQTTENDGKKYLPGILPLEPKEGYDVAVLDLAPNETDLRAYNLLNAKPEADYFSVLKRPELPHAVIYHTAWGELSRQHLETWLTEADNAYKTKCGCAPLVWVISASETLRALAARYGVYVTDHGEFSDWCSARVSGVNSGPQAHRELRREIMRWLSGVGRMEHCINTWNDVAEALNCQKKPSDFRLTNRMKSWMDTSRAPIDPAVAWWMRRGLKSIGCWAGTKTWAKGLRMRLKKDSRSIKAVLLGQK